MKRAEPNRSGLIRVPKFGLSRKSAEFGSNDRKSAEFGSKDHQSAEFGSKDCKSVEFSLFQSYRYRFGS